MTIRRLGYICNRSFFEAPVKQLIGALVAETYIDEVKKAGVIFIQLERLMTEACEGDTIVTQNMNMFGSSLEELEYNILRLIIKKVKIEFLNEKITLSAEFPQMVFTFLHAMHALLNFKRNIKDSGTGTLSEEDIPEARLRVASGETEAAVAKDYNTTIATLRKILGKHG